MKSLRMSTEELKSKEVLMVRTHSAREIGTRSRSGVP